MQTVDIHAAKTHLSRLVDADDPRLSRDMRELIEGSGNDVLFSTARRTA